MLCARWLVLAAAVWGGARAQPPAPRPVCPPDLGRRCLATGEEQSSPYHFIVNGMIVTYTFIDGDFFDLSCSSTTLDEMALPQFEPALRVREVRLEYCWPGTGSFEAALHALNVTDLDGHSTRAESPKYLIQLNITRVKTKNLKLLTDMTTLRNLSIADVAFTDADLALLPAGLESLELWSTGVNRVPATALARLTHLRELRMYSFEPIVLESAGKLSSLVILYSPATTLESLSLPDTLGTLQLPGWRSRHPSPWSSCANLDSLEISFTDAETLPDMWLARCVRLRLLHLERAKNLAMLSARALHGARALEVVLLINCVLETLPVGLLRDARALRVLDLQGNRLHTLPSGLFTSSVLLSQLDLSSNNLTDAVMGVIGDMPSMSELRLDGNPLLDACPPSQLGAHNTTREWSPLQNSRNLSMLSLSHTATSRVCPAWRRLPRLRELDLSDTPIKQFNYTDLQFNTTVNITVTLSKVDLALRRDNYKSIAGAPAGPTLTLSLTVPLRCDCKLFWVAAVARLPDTRLRVEDALCENERKLLDIPLEELVCTPPGPCPEGCACVAHEDMKRLGPVLRLDCAQARLSRMPRVIARDMLNYTGAEPVLLDLNLEDNHIDQLAPEDLPRELAALNLRYNALAVIGMETMARLVSQADRRVRLAGNPLDCGCRAADTLASMRAHTDVFYDWANATCSDGTALSLAEPQPCEDNNTDTVAKAVVSSRGMSAGAVAALVMCAAVVVALGMALTRPSVRRRLRGLPPPLRSPSILRLQRRRPEPNEWAYDAFVSFAHADEAVAHELVETLEGGDEPLRLCVHYRDWVPGGWIPEQIAASVRVSRRTVALVSEAFLRSKWARAEFREAYAAALEDTEPRLVLVLLEEPERLRLDLELRAYISGNTYVRWGDPWFWQKLRQALPAASPRPETEAAARMPGSADFALLPQESTTATHV